MSGRLFILSLLNLRLLALNSFGKFWAGLHGVATLYQNGSSQRSLSAMKQANQGNPLS